MLLPGPSISSSGEADMNGHGKGEVSSRRSFVGKLAAGAVAAGVIGKGYSVLQFEYVAYRVDISLRCR